MNARRMFRGILVIFLVSAAALFAQAPGGQEQPEFVKRGQALMGEGKLAEALALYRKTLQDTPDSQAANNAAGVVVVLLGKRAEGGKNFAQVIDLAKKPQDKTAGGKAMGKYEAFSGDCQQKRA